MKFGLLYEMQRPHTDYKIDHTALIEETLEQCVLADEVGYLVEFGRLAIEDGELGAVTLADDWEVRRRMDVEGGADGEE